MCLNCMIDQSHWIMRLSGSRSDPGTVKQHRVLGGFWSCCPCVAVQGETWFSQKRDVSDCDRWKVEFQQVAVHGEKITLKAMFELLLVRRPILSVSRLVEKRFVVVMGNDLGNKMSKNGREIHLRKSNGVYHVRSSALSELCLLEEQEPTNDAGPPGAGQAACGHDDFNTNPLPRLRWTSVLSSLHPMMTF